MISHHMESYKKQKHGHCFFFDASTAGLRRPEPYISQAEAITRSKFLIEIHGGLKKGEDQNKKLH